MAGIAVEQHERGADQQARHEVVPHHPAGGARTRRSGRPGRGRCAGPAPCGARAGCRRGRARSAWAGRWCPTSTGRTAGGRTAPARTASARRRPGASAQQLVPGDRVRRAGRSAVEVGHGDRGPQRRQRGADGGHLGGAGRSPWRRSGSRRRPAAPSARSGAAGRRRCGCRTRARTTTRSRPGWRWPGTRPPSRGCWAGRPPPGRPGRTPEAHQPGAAPRHLVAQLVHRQPRPGPGSASSPTSAGPRGIAAAGRARRS